MFLGVDGDAGRFAQIEVGWELQEIGNRLEGDFRDLRPSAVIAERDRSEAS